MLQEVLYILFLSEQEPCVEHIERFCEDVYHVVYLYKMILFIVFFFIIIILLIPLDL